MADSSAAKVAELKRLAASLTSTPATAKALCDALQYLVNEIDKEGGQVTDACLGSDNSGFQQLCKALSTVWQAAGRHAQLPYWRSTGVEVLNLISSFAYADGFISSHMVRHHEETRLLFKILVEACTGSVPAYSAAAASALCLFTPLAPTDAGDTALYIAAAYGAMDHLSAFDWNTSSPLHWTAVACSVEQGVWLLDRTVRKLGLQLALRSSSTSGTRGAGGGAAAPASQDRTVAVLLDALSLCPTGQQWVYWPLLLLRAALHPTIPSARDTLLLSPDIAPHPSFVGQPAVPAGLRGQRLIDVLLPYAIACLQDRRLEGAREQAADMLQLGRGHTALIVLLQHLSSLQAYAVCDGVILAAACVRLVGPLAFTAPASECAHADSARSAVLEACHAVPADSCRDVNVALLKQTCETVVERVWGAVIAKAGAGSSSSSSAEPEKPTLLQLLVTAVLSCAAVQSAAVPGAQLHALAFLRDCATLLLEYAADSRKGSSGNRWSVADSQVGMRVVNLLTSAVAVVYTSQERAVSQEGGAQARTAGALQPSSSASTAVRCDAIYTALYVFACGGLSCTDVAQRWLQGILGREVRLLRGMSVPADSLETDSAHTLALRTALFAYVEATTPARSPQSEVSGQVYSSASVLVAPFHCDTLTRLQHAPCGEHRPPYCPSTVREWEPRLSSSSDSEGACSDDSCATCACTKQLVRMVDTATLIVQWSQDGAGAVLRPAVQRVWAEQLGRMCVMVQEAETVQQAEAVLNSLSRCVSPLVAGTPMLQGPWTEAVRSCDRALHGKRSAPATQAEAAGSQQQQKAVESITAQARPAVVPPAGGGRALQREDDEAIMRLVAASGAAFARAAPVGQAAAPSPYKPVTAGAGAGEGLSRDTDTRKASAGEQQATSSLGKRHAVEKAPRSARSRHKSAIVGSPPNSDDGNSDEGAELSLARRDSL